MDEITRLVQNAYQQDRLSEWLEKYKNEIYIYAAGQLGRKLAKLLIRNNITPKGFIDRDPLKHGKNYEGIPIFSLDNHTISKDALIAVSLWHNGISFLDIKSDLESNGFNNIMSPIQLFWTFPEDILPFYCIDTSNSFKKYSQELIHVYNLLEDPISKEQFYSLVKWRTTGDYNGISQKCSEQYFVDDIYRLQSSDILVDGGSWIGDTIQNYIKVTNGEFEAVHAFEADRGNLEQLKNFIDQLESEIKSRITIYPFALWDDNEEIIFIESNSYGSSVDNEIKNNKKWVSDNKNRTKINAKKLDEILVETRVTLLKLDVEGAEIKALKGSKQKIVETRPILMVCLYHKPNDIWEIPMFLEEILIDYKYYLRIHGTDAWEVVLYAVPIERANND